MGARRHPYPTQTVVQNQSLAAVEEDSMSGLVIKVFDDLDTVGADVVLLHDCLQNCMPNLSKVAGRGVAGAEEISHRGFVG